MPAVFNSNVIRYVHCSVHDVHLHVNSWNLCQTKYHIAEMDIHVHISNIFYARTIRTYTYFNCSIVIKLETYHINGNAAQLLSAIHNPLAEFLVSHNLYSVSGKQTSHRVKAIVYYYSYTNNSYSGIHCAATVIPLYYCRHSGQLKEIITH